MSYPIKPDHRYLISQPQISGQKALKIELFQIAQFKHRWSLDTRNQFSPCLPFRPNDRIMYWKSDMFRVRVDGVWHKGESQYIFMTQEQVVNRWVLNI